MLLGHCGNIPAQGELTFHAKKINKRRKRWKSSPERDSNSPAYLTLEHVNRWATREAGASPRSGGKLVCGTGQAVERNRGWDGRESKESKPFACEEPERPRSPSRRGGRAGRLISPSEPGAAINTARAGCIFHQRRPCFLGLCVLSCQRACPALPRYPAVSADKTAGRPLVGAACTRLKASPIAMPPALDFCLGKFKRKEVASNELRGTSSLSKQGTVLYHQPPPHHLSRTPRPPPHPQPVLSILVAWTVRRQKNLRQSLWGAKTVRLSKSEKVIEASNSLLSDHN